MVRGDDDEPPVAAGSRAPAGGAASGFGQAAGLIAGHSPDFVAAWRSVFCDVYRWRREGRFAIVPSLPGAREFAYLPGLDYTDLNAADARELARQMAGRAFNVRALTAAGEEPPAGSPAVFRVDLAAFGHDRESVWKRALHLKRRSAVRRARKAGLRCGEEAGPAAVATLFRLVSETLTRHGAPLVPTALFEAVTRAFEARILVVRDRAGEARASLLWLRDGPLAWTPWGGMARSTGNPGVLLFWTMMEQALREGAGMVDFGRSPVGGGACRFKREFGAVPVPVLWLSDRPFDLYRRYASAQKLWRALPGFVTRGLGPRVRRRLADQ